MLLNFFDISTSIIQCILIAWGCNNVAYKENKPSKMKSFLLVVVTSSFIIGFTHITIKLPYINLIVVFVLLLICMIFYRKSVVDALLGFGTIYGLIVLTSYFLFLFYNNVISKLSISLSNEIKLAIFIYIPVWIVYALVYRSRKFIFYAVLYIKSITKSLVFFLIFIYIIVVFDTVCLQTQQGKIDAVFISIFSVSAVLIGAFTIIYFAKVHEKSAEVEMLNNALNEKITELRKVKHDYGSEISGLYGLYQMGRSDRLGEMLKNIVDRSQALNTSICVTVQATPIVKAVFSSIESTSIDLIVKDEADYEDIAITDGELFKVISNIIRNSVDALKEVRNPIIRFKSNNLYDAVLITISNNGPEIPKETNDRIFQEGFSTKNNLDCDRGYGLSIVSDIINKCNGKITIDSNKKLTQFNIEIPYKKL